MSGGTEQRSAPGTPAVTDEPWFLKSPFYDAVSMSAVVLGQLQSELRCVEAPLYCLEITDMGFVLRTFDKITTIEDRERAERELTDASPDARVFFIDHIFEHTAPDGLDPRKKGVMRFMLGLSSEALPWLFTHQQIHPMFLESLHSHVGHYAVYETLDNTDKPSHLHICVKVAPAGHLEAAFYIKYNYTTRKTIAIVAGSELVSHFKILADNFQRGGPPSDPFGLACLIVTGYFRFLEAQKIQVDHAVIMTERETGRGAVAYSDGQATHTISPDKFDLTYMHWIEGNQRNIVYAAESQVRLADFLIEEHMQYIQQRNTTHFERHKLAGVERAIHERLKSHKQLAEGLWRASLIIRERVQRQLNAADSIINQSDSKVSLSNAEANTKIAEQSRRIAEETRRDSTWMKTIASLTMVYLPSTFAATVFGTGFFTYQAAGHAVFQVNSQIWKLIAVALILSLLTVGIWVWINKYGIPTQLSWARQDKTERKAADATDSSMTTSTGSNGKSRPPLTVVSAPKLNLPVSPEDIA